MDGCILRKREFCSESQSWSSWFVLYSRNCSSPFFKLSLNFCGEVCIYRGLVSGRLQAAVTTEALQSQYFRQYSAIQGENEPRLNALYHENATTKFEDAQPSYIYKQVRMKARPLEDMPNLRKLSRRIERCVKEQYSGYYDNVGPFWNVGVNEVLYRSSKDAIGFHADNSQGETLIFTLIVHCPDERKVVIRTAKHNKTKTIELGDEEIEIYLKAGDGYSFDGMSFLENHFLTTTVDDNSLLELITCYL
jgi:2OG-Fe(II) oxygenase superfamily